MYSLVTEVDWILDFSCLRLFIELILLLYVIYSVSVLAIDNVLRIKDRGLMAPQGLNGRVVRRSTSMNRVRTVFSKEIFTTIP